NLPMIIAHSDNHQIYFDKHLSWGCQWEIARLTSSGRIKSYEDIALPSLKDLHGKSNEVGAPMVETLLCARTQSFIHREVYEEAHAKELANKKDAWVELDREEEHLKEDTLSGLGGKNAPDEWYGGKIAFIAKLRQKEAKKPVYHLELQAPEISTSTRISRRWGSSRLIRISIPDSILYQSNNGVLTYFKNDFIIHGRIFRPFYAKEHAVFLIQLDYIYKDGVAVHHPPFGMISFDEFLKWHNPMPLNKDQSLSKWCARMALGLSNSAPGLELPRENIKFIDDLYSLAGQRAIEHGHKPESKDIVTDGSGFASYSVFTASRYKFKWDLVPCAIQFRMFGAKGLFLLDPDEDGNSDNEPRVWIRNSQRKIVYEFPDRAHLIMDVLRRSQLKYPARLSVEIIVNLAENGISYETFQTLMDDGLEGVVASLTNWSGPFAMENLWAAVARVNGSVIRSRMAREAAGSSRLMGFTSYDREREEGENEEEEEEDDDAIGSFRAGSKAWWADEISGCPSTLEEAVLVLLDAGFQPHSCALLAAKLKEVFKKALKRYIEKYKITVPRSAEAWIVPDPCGVLEPDEIFLKTSINISGRDGISRDHLLGDVLVTRHPCRVPSDIQKVRAVWKDELRKYCDVIIFSVKGERSLASMLGGGDYDGDCGHIIWEPLIVDAFHQPSAKFADPPQAVENAFEKNTLTVSQYLSDHREHITLSQMSRLHDHLLAALKDVSLVGQYSNWHDVAVYKLGYDHDEAWRMAYMFCAILDSSKTGKIIKPQYLQHDRKKYGGRAPDWKGRAIDDKIALPPSNEAPRRQGKLGQIKFIMDHLKEGGMRQYHGHMAKFEKFLSDAQGSFKVSKGIQSEGTYVDSALMTPWEAAQRRAQLLLDTTGQSLMKQELEVIKNHVDNMRKKYRERKQGNNKVRSPLRKDNTSFTSRPIEERQDILRQLSLEFNQMPDIAFITLSPEDTQRYKASYAYITETEEREKRYGGFSRFPFDMAMRELCKIKAASCGGHKTVTSTFYSVFNVVGAIQAFRFPEVTNSSYTV
ncbi:RNA dependent RNA polymerase-domain-containing protein, partial [Hysterangium stoloniferum]